MQSLRYEASEAQEQIALFEWAAVAAAVHPELALLYHIPNGGSRNKLEAANLKRQGVRSGVPDIHLPVARGGYHGLYIELKTASGKPSKNQEKWIDALRGQGYAAVICIGWESARQVLEKYLKGRKI